MSAIVYIVGYLALACVLLLVIDIAITIKDEFKEKK